MSSEFDERVKKIKAMTQPELEAEFDRRETGTLELVQSQPERTETFDHGRYKLTCTTHKTKEGCWNYSKGVISVDGRDPIVIPRNYCSFWHLFVDHPNGKEYLLCGHDYQGYDCVNLTDWKRHRYVPRDALWGCGFCWASVYPDPEKLQIIVEGCYWACPYELHHYDFANPDILPYPLLSSEDCPDDEENDDEEENCEAEKS